MTVQPGNLFASGTEVALAVEAEGVPSVSWLATDYQGAKVAAGEAELAVGRAEVRLGKLPLGYYELRCEAAGAVARMSLGVVGDQTALARPEGPLAVDGATSWHEAQGRHDLLARMLRTAGVPWMRDRFSWEGTEPDKGRDDWAYYDSVTAPFVDAGIRLCEVFHDSPTWSHGDRTGSPNPSDLRDVYNWARRAGEHYRGRVGAWEAWNEPDIEFWQDSADAYAGFLKAGYLGFKASSPEQPVLLGSLCRGYCAFDENLFEAGAAGYYDIFNWHYYGDPASCGTALSQYLDLLERHGCAERPIWLTESGIALWASEPDGELSVDDERRQAEFVPKSVASSLAAGTDRHFSFLLPYMFDGGVQFGFLHRDLSPRPAFIALAAAADILGEARYLGRYEFTGDGAATGLVFGNGGGTVMVLWSEAQHDLTLETGAPAVQVANVVGTRETRQTDAGRLRLSVGPSPQYVIGLGEAAVQRVDGPVRPPGKLPTLRPSAVVVRGDAPGAKLNKAANCFLTDGRTFEYRVEVCNLSEQKPVDGQVRLEPPAGWAAAPADARVSLPPMGREVLRFAITPGAPAGGTQKLWARAEFEGASPAPSVTYFRFDASLVVPVDALDLGLGIPTAWERFCSDNAAMEITPGPEGGIHASVRFPVPGDRWCYPLARFAEPRDFSRYEGISFEFRCDRDDPETVLRAQLMEPQGSFYLAGDWHATAAWTPVVCMFGDFLWGAFSASDPNQRLDPSAIGALAIGANTPRDDLWLELRNVRLVSYREPR